MTLRHHVYNKHQLSGHFHNDAASVTLSVDGVPIFVDPGSFIYTPSAFWRNSFRSVSAHNTFWMEGIEPVVLDHKFLFNLDLPESSINGWFGKREIKTHHKLYKRFGLEAHRKIELDDTCDNVTITDAWKLCPDTENTLWGFAKGCWNFTLAPEIKAVQEGSVWKFSKNGKFLAQLFSEHLKFECVDGWFSPNYGTKIPIIRLRARAPIVPDQELQMKVSLL